MIESMHGAWYLNNGGHRALRLGACIDTFFFYKYVTHARLLILYSVNMVSHMFMEEESVKFTVSLR